ncbi:hypothetical protein GCM10025870_26980 [Agromyces marinus]|uniref:Uncharacterized protein n=1 Tax=Agromyces marinus TaxID=1389020 RepID=A0ABM8H4G8_9MICO|nr:hypothetical protein GCM10025870_26980 [Agromyces marinus]
MTATEAAQAQAPTANGESRAVAPGNGDSASGPVVTATGARPSTGPLFAGRALRTSGKVLPEHARSHNRALVLQTLYSLGPQSRADVARETGLTRVTISDLVAELIGDGLVVELGQREDARPGKPATLIDVDRAGHHVVALDLSEHTRFRGAVLDLDGGVIARAEVALDGATGERAFELVAELLDGLLALTTEHVLGIGVGSPGIVEPTGIVRAAPNLGWVDLPSRAGSSPRSTSPSTSRTTPTSPPSPSMRGPPATSCSSRSATASAPGSSSAAAPSAAPAARRARSATSSSEPTAGRAAHAARTDASRHGSPCPG